MNVIYKPDHVVHSGGILADALIDHASGRRERLVVRKRIPTFLRWSKLYRKWVVRSAYRQLWDQIKAAEIEVPR